MDNHKRLYTAAIIGICLVGMVAYGIYWAFYDIQHIDGQVLLDHVMSPDETYTVSLYRNNGGATTGYAVLGVLANNETGYHKNIYWQYLCSDATASWLNEETVTINGHELEVRSDVYDYRRE